MDPQDKIFPRSSLRGALSVFVGIVAGGLVGAAGAVVAVKFIVGVAAAVVVLGITTAYGPYKRDERFRGKPHSRPVRAGDSL